MNEIIRERWTNAEGLILLPMHQAGTPVLDIARALGKTYGATQTRVNRKGCGRSEAKVKRGNGVR